mgnify:CR=1 FL=1
MDEAESLISDAAFFGDGLEPAHGFEVQHAQNALGDILAQIREHHNAQERHMQHSGAQQRQRDGDDPETCKVEDHARQRIAAGAEHAHDLHIGDVAEAVFQRAEDRHGVGSRDRRGRKIVARGEQRHERVPRRDHGQTHDEAHQRHQHGKPPRVGDAAPDLTLADGFADHDDARAAKADEEGEGQFRKRLEDGHARVIFIAHVGVDAVERQHAEGPQSLVRHDGQRPRAELAQLLPAEREQLPHGSDEYVFLKHGKQQDQHRPQPRRDARRDRRALNAELRQAERAEDQAVVRKGVGNGRHNGDIERQPDALRAAQDVGQQIRQRDGRIREADDPQIPAARVQHARVLIKKSHDPCRGRQRDGQKQQRHEQREHQPQPHDAPDPLVILDAPVLRDEYAHARAQAEVQQVAQPAPLRGHADGRERHVAEPRDHHRIDQLERARQHVLQRHRQRQPRGHAPEGLIAQIISQFHKK